jgi:hypothetical protein
MTASRNSRAPRAYFGTLKGLDAPRGLGVGWKVVRGAQQEGKLRMVNAMRETHPSPFTRLEHR